MPFIDNCVWDFVRILLPTHYHLTCLTNSFMPTSFSPVSKNDCELLWMEMEEEVGAAARLLAEVFFTEYDVEDEDEYEVLTFFVTVFFTVVILRYTEVKDRNITGISLNLD